MHLKSAVAVATLVLVNSKFSNVSMATFNDVRQMLRRWDKGSKSTRSTMLQDFILQCESMTAPELEQQFCDCASLFLARLTAWLRLSYMSGTCLELQLKAISIFISAASGQRFLMEFLEVGGMLTALEVVGLKSAKDTDKAEALRLLTVIADKGRQYKELICESYGVKLIAECLALSSNEDTQEAARNILYQLSTGNPRYQSQVYKALMALLSSASCVAQRMAAHTLRLVQPSMGVASASIVEPVLQLLRNLNLDVQHEAAALLEDLISYEEIQQPILMGLVGMLKATEDGPPGTAPSATSIPNPLLESEPGLSQAPLPVHIQQAGAAQVISMLAEKHLEIAARLIELNVVVYLMYAMGNTSYVESQRQASIALSVFVKKVVTVEKQVRSIMGDDFFQLFISAPDKLYDVLTPSQIDVLVGCLTVDTQ